VDAFLGEWLNPQYFDHITPPPPSPMMVAAAKAELLQSETIDIFTPSVSHRASISSLWGGSNAQKPGSRDNSLDDLPPVDDTVPTLTSRRDRSNSVSSAGSNDSGSGRKSPFRPGHVLQPFVSTVPKPEVTVYAPPVPQYAVSSADHIPRGYVTHARQACTDVDYQWDSSRSPQDWGDGGEYGEEWSAMHKRFRKGFNHLIEWYSQHDADDRAEDALGLEQAEKHHEDEEEDLVVVLVTHGAGSNALIGALTGQPVLLDVGMASLTMAVRKENAPPIVAKTPTSAPSEGVESHPSDRNGHAGKEFADLGLSAVYEMQLISSSEHLRPGADPARAPSLAVARSMRSGADSGSQYRQRFPSDSSTAAGAGADSSWRPTEPKRGSSNSNLGSMRRPTVATPTASFSGQLGNVNTSMLSPSTDIVASPTGLWTPPTSRTPQLQAQTVKEERANIFSSLNDAAAGRTSPGRDLVLDFSTSPPDSRPTSSSGPKREPTPASSAPAAQQEKEILAPAAPLQRKSLAMALDGSLPPVGIAPDERDDGVSELPKVGALPPAALSRGLSQRGLWGTKPAGDKVARRFPQEPKRRWTLGRDDGAVH